MSKTESGDQTTLDDDELFGEAASEVRSDVEAALERTWAALPDPDAIWETEADNVLGVLNGLKTALDAEDAGEHLREAKKWFTMGQRAGAFEDEDVLEGDIAEAEAAFEEVSRASERVAGLTTTIPALRSTLDRGPIDGVEPPEAPDGDSEDEDDE